jgi:hypothetical protein
MELDAAQLSSLSSALEQLTDRIVAIANEFAGSPRENAAADLYDVERHLNAANRRLKSLVDRL